MAEASLCDNDGCCSACSEVEPCQRETPPSLSCLAVDGRPVLEFAQRWGLGFCPEQDTVYRATIACDDWGHFILSGSTASAVEEGCGPYGFPCVVEDVAPPRVMSDDEASTLLYLLENKPEPYCDFDDSVACDPCLIKLFTFSGSSEQSSCCSPDEPYAIALADLEAFLYGALLGI